jgi:hypothetical protein
MPDNSGGTGGVTARLEQENSLVLSDSDSKVGEEHPDADITIVSNEHD